MSRLPMLKGEFVLALGLGIAELGCGGRILQLPLLLDPARRRPIPSPHPPMRGTARPTPPAPPSRYEETRKMMLELEVEYPHGVPAHVRRQMKQSGLSTLGDTTTMANLTAPFTRAGYSNY